MSDKGENLLWSPSLELNSSTNLFKYMEWLGLDKSLSFSDNHKLWAWSVSSPDDFWTTMLSYFEISYSGNYEQVGPQFEMPGVKWFDKTEVVDSLVQTISSISSTIWINQGQKSTDNPNSSTCDTVMTSSMQTELTFERVDFNNPVWVLYSPDSTGKPKAITYSQGGISGRSNTTLNRGEVRIGTSEIYSALEGIEEIAHSLIICINREDGTFFMPLFVKLKTDRTWSNDLINEIKHTLKTKYTARHVPDDIIQVQDIPYTISGKKLETPVKKILMDAISNRGVKARSFKEP